jgi:2-polyprenyl-3-methyl-5-hydroxy-6-metoxy-1,4-benzoquinol methylase
MGFYPTGRGFESLPGYQLKFQMDDISLILDEQAFAGKEHLYPEYISGYDVKSAYNPAEDIDVFRERGMSNQSTVIDMGAGTGLFAASIAGLCKSVIAIDVSPQMISYLKKRTKGLHNVQAVESGFLSYEHSAEPVDFIFCRNAIHHLPDFWKAIALTRLSSFIKTGGILRIHDIIFDFTPEEANRKIDKWLKGAANNSQFGYTSKDLTEHLKTEFSTYSWIFEKMLQNSGFEIINRKYRRSVYGSYTCIKT